MCWLVTVVLLAHLAATLTGAWRESQPRLQFTHSGKTQHLISFFFCFCLCSSHLLLSDMCVTPTHVTHLFFSLVPTHSCDMKQKLYLCLPASIPHLCNHLHWFNLPWVDKLQHPPHFLLSPFEFGIIYLLVFFCPTQLWWQQQSLVCKM